jgi:hypothetical protein
MSRCLKTNTSNSSSRKSTGLPSPSYSGVSQPLSFVMLLLALKLLGIEHTSLACLKMEGFFHLASLEMSTPHPGNAKVS